MKIIRWKVSHKNVRKLRTIAMVENIEMIASVGNLTDASYVSGMCVDWAKYPLW